MLPSWSTKPETIFQTVLYLTSPVWFYLTVWLWQRGRSWYAARSELAARASIEYLKRQMENPPTLVESLAYIICFLPLPFLLVFIALLLYFSPAPPSWFPRMQDVHLAHEIVSAFLNLLFFCMYALFGVLTVHGIKVISRLRHGAARYADHYRLERERRIEKLIVKFPRL
jgi:hypothetical protein